MTIVCRELLAMYHYVCNTSLLLVEVVILFSFSENMLLTTCLIL